MKPALKSVRDDIERRKQRKVARQERRDARKRLAEIDAMPDEQRASDAIAKERGELTTRLATATNKLDDMDDEDDDAAIAKRSTSRVIGHPEADELATLFDGFSFSAVARAASGIGEAPSGQTAELQQHYGIGPADIPSHAVLPWRDAEGRAVTPGPANDPGSAVSDAPAFATGLLAMLRAFSPMPDRGIYNVNPLTTRPNVRVVSDSTDVAETTGEFGSTELKPKRLQAEFFAREGDVIASPEMETAMRTSLEGGLSEALDKMVVDQIVADVARTNSGNNPDTYNTLVAAILLGLVDGRYAARIGDLRHVFGASVFAFTGTLFKQEVSLLDYLTRVGGGYAVSPHIAALDANKRQDVIVRKGERVADLVVPVWRNVRIRVDEDTRSDTGEIRFTAQMFANAKVAYTDGFARVQVDTAA